MPGLCRAPRPSSQTRSGFGTSPASRKQLQNQKKSHHGQIARALLSATVTSNGRMHSPRPRDPGHRDTSGAGLVPEEVAKASYYSSTIRPIAQSVTSPLDASSSARNRLAGWRPDGNFLDQAAACGPGRAARQGRRALHPANQHGGRKQRCSHHHQPLISHDHRRRTTALPADELDESPGRPYGATTSPRDGGANRAKTKSRRALSGPVISETATAHGLIVRRVVETGRGAKALQRRATITRADARMVAPSLAHPTIPTKSRLNAETPASHGRRTSGRSRHSF